MASDISELARRLARDAEAVCRFYLPNGRREGRYWLVGDVRNTAGRSMFVRLRGPESGKGAAGKWADAATGEHGDLLDVIRESCGLATIGDGATEARRFLGLPRPDRYPAAKPAIAPPGSLESARRLFVMSRSLSGTLAEAYLRGRGITALHGTQSLRFHPRCYYRHGQDRPVATWPAMIAAVTRLDGVISGVHRTWLSRDGSGKALVATPRRAMGELAGHAVRFGMADNVMAVGEGIETVLSLRMALPLMPMAAALSAAHLAAILFPPSLRRLYIVRDNDPAGDWATNRLIARAHEVRIEALPLHPRLGDFNDDLRRFGVGVMRTDLRVQLVPEDVGRFMMIEDEAGKGKAGRCDGGRAPIRLSRSSRRGKEPRLRPS